VGTFSATLCVNTPDFVGPVSNLLDGADISSLVGPIMGAGIYTGMTLFARRRRIAATDICMGEV